MLPESGSKYQGVFGFTFLNSGSINCDTTDDFSSLWHKVFAEILQHTTKTVMGLTGETRTESVALNQSLPAKVTPNDVRTRLASLGGRALIIIDELDRLTDKAARGLLADTIKTLSDNFVEATLILVGVAESVNDLIAEHESIDRALVQVRMPRMSQQELFDIISTGERSGALPFTLNAKRLIVGLSQGLPHYTHLLCLEASLSAINSSTQEVTETAVESGIQTIIRNRATLSASYERATRSQHRENLHEKVLLACALAKCDAEGYFMSPDVADKLQEITGITRPVSIFQRHLGEFCDPKRRPVLCRKGERRLFRYRFVDPLMQPYVLLQGMNKKLLKPHTVYKQAELDLRLN